MRIHNLRLLEEHKDIYVLVLVGTTTFDNEVAKDVTMGSLGVITVAMLVLRVIGSRQKEEEEAF